MLESKDRPADCYAMGWILLLALLTALGPLSVDMYLPALQLMAMDFAVNTSMVSNTLPAYFFGLAIGQLIYGPLSDRIGRKKPLYWGLGIYVIASLLCVFTTHIGELIALRVLQALGGCVGVVIARAAIRDRLDIKTSAQAFASLMMILAVAPIIAPSIGALLLRFFSWHAIFILLLCVGITCLVCVHYFFAETLPKNSRSKLSLVQILVQYFELFKDSSFRLPMMIGCFTGGVMFSFLNSAATIMIGEYELSQQNFGFLFGLNGIGIILLSRLNKRLTQSYSILDCLKIGVFIQFFGVVLLMISTLFISSSLWSVLTGIFFIVSAMGLIGPNAMALAMSQQGNRAGAASAVMGSTHFACGLASGVVLNFLVMSPLMNMTLVMAIFICIALVALYQLNIKMTKCAVKQCTE